MGRRRFRMVDMLPNSWFYKLKEKNMAPRAAPAAAPKARSPSHPHPPPLPSKQTLKPGRPSNYIPSNSQQRSTHLPGSPLHPKASDTKFLLDSPRKSAKKKTRKILLNRSSPSQPQTPPPPLSTKSSILDVESDPIIDLPPIVTRPKKTEAAELIPKSPRKRSGTGGHGIRVGSNSPRLAARKAQPRRRARSGDTRKGLAGSFPVVKSSANPQQDFRDSMVEMIVENNITSGEEMEELLSCYLSLNSKQYHDVIVEVFKQIWLQLTAAGT